jgi:glutamate 5-kinase
MASKLAAAKIATWSGLPAVIAGAARPNVLPDAVAGVPGVGTVFRPRPTRLSARKLWIAFAVGANGRVTVDAGARAALEARSVSLLPAGVTAVAGEFAAGDAVELVDPAGTVFAKGLVRYGVTDLATSAGLRTAELRPDLPAEVIHRDDLVLLP